MAPSPEKHRLYSLIRDCAADNVYLEEHLQTNFVPTHNQDELIGPRAFFESPLFHVRSVSCPRKEHLELILPTAAGKPLIRYKGPELRQSDGLVFMSLLHMMRDVQAGTTVSFSPELLCTALYGRYDGQSRSQLRVGIRRLQTALVIFPTFSVQLCMRFDYPRAGPWTVGLDAQIVQLFKASAHVWLSVHRRRSLPDGLPTWLYCFIQCQTKLIPMKLILLAELCGSNSEPRAFTNSLRKALKQLAEAEVISGGWSIKQGTVRWMKQPRK